MLRVMIKNNFKLMFRNPWVMLLLILGPVVIIAILSAAFHSVLKTYEKKADFTAGYDISQDSPYAAAFEQMIENKEDSSIRWIACDKEDFQELMKNQKVQVGVSIDGTDVEILGSQESKVQANTVEFVIFSLMHGMAQPVSIEKVDHVLVPVPDSIDYYGKIELIFFMMCSVIMLSPVISSERRNRIQERLKISCAGKVQLYLAKLIPGFLLTVVTSAIAILISTLAYEISWGCYGKTIGLFLLEAAVASAFGIFLFYLIQNVGAAVVSGFVLIWVLGFFGGSFETYMYASTPESLKRLSPLYFINRALVEYQTIGHSDYGIPCALFMASLFVLFALGGCLLMNRRMEVI